MNNWIVYFLSLVAFFCVALVTVDMYEGAGDLDRHPAFRWVMLLVYLVIILSVFGSMAAIVWRGVRRQRAKR